LVALEVAGPLPSLRLGGSIPSQRDYDVKIMAATNRIVLDPAIHHGKPVIRGTRVPVTVVVGTLGWWHDLRREIPA